MCDAALISSSRARLPPRRPCCAVVIVFNFSWGIGLPMEDPQGPRAQTGRLEPEHEGVHRVGRKGVVWAWAGPLSSSADPWRAQKGRNPCGLMVLECTNALFWGASFSLGTFVRRAKAELGVHAPARRGR